MKNLIKTIGYETCDAALRGDYRCGNSACLAGWPYGAIGLRRKYQDTAPPHIILKKAALAANYSDV